MMRVLTVLLMLVLTGIALATPAVRGYADASNYWLAISRDSRSGETLTGRTTVRIRDLGGDNQWRRLMELPDTVQGLTDLGGSLVLLTSSGRLYDVYETSDLTNPASVNEIRLPTGARALSVATVGGQLLMAGTLDDQLVLWRREGRDWTPLELPAAAAKVGFERVLLASAGELWWIALLAEGRADVFSIDADGNWSDAQTFELNLSSTRNVGFDVDSQTPVLWWEQDGAVHALPATQGGTPVTLAWQGDEPQDVQARAVVLAGVLRQVIVTDAGAMEAAYASLDTASDGVLTPQATPTTLPNPAHAPAGVQEWLNLFLLTLLVMLTFSIFRNTPAKAAALELAVKPAAVPLRLAAGLIDLIPVLIAGAIVLFVRAGDDEPPDATATPDTILIFGGFLIYLAHTMAGEWRYGRSIGKAIFGLWVLRPDGTSPSKDALVLRNLLRTLDVPLVFPLALVLVSPLRQRMGDVLAETIVARRPPSPEPLTLVPTVQEVEPTV